MSLILAYLLVGAVAGTMAGLFGIGGGLIIVPVLVFAFESQGFSTEVLTHMAVATSLATIVFTSLSSIKTHHDKGAVDWPVVARLSTGIMVGAILGVWTADLLSGTWLQIIIGVFAIIIAIQMGFGLKPKPSRDLPGSVTLSGAGGLIGWASSICGIGGGSLTVPYLTWCNYPMQKSVAVAAACGFPIAFIAATANIFVGWNHAELPLDTLGYVYWPALIGIALTSVPFARVGALLAHRLSAEKLKRLFALLLVLVGIKFLSSGLLH